MRPRAVVLALLALAAAALLSACGSSDDNSGDAAAAAAPSTSASAPASGNAAGAVTDRADLSGVTLRVGDLGTRSKLQALLAASGEERGIPYKVEYSIFPAGPQLIAAQASGSVDLGWMANTPPIFAQGAGQDVRIVAAATPAGERHVGTAIIVKRDSQIRTIADLKGKKVGLTTSTIMEYLLVKELERAGLRYSDVQRAPLPLTNGESALQNGSIDAWVTIDPQLSISLARGDTRVLATGDGVDPGIYVLTAAGDALDDAAKGQAAADFVARLTRAQQWANDNPDQWAAAYSQVLGVPVAIGRAIAERSQAAWRPIGPEVIEAQQDQADLFQQLGQIRSKIDASREFDNRFDATVASASRGGS